MATSFRDMFIQNFGKLVFRRVAEARSVNAPCVYIKSGYDVEGIYTELTVSESNRHTLKREDLQKNVDMLSSNYYFETTMNPIRSSDTYYGIRIHGYRKFKGDVTEDLQVVSGSERKSSMPQIGDLVSGFVDKNEKGYYYTVWFICSDQFLHMWTSIMEPESEALCKKIPRGMDKEYAILRNLMSGNRLCTNSFLKHTLGCHQSGIPFPPEEMQERYYSLRTETPSIRYVHLYAAVVLMIRYGTLPTDENVPNNIDRKTSDKKTTAKLTKWSLPTGWLDMIISKFPNYAQQSIYPLPKEMQVAESMDSVVVEKPSAQAFDLQDHSEFPSL